jgi:alpha-D-xyloside xylohydrolase
MFGPSLLINPVTVYKARTRQVYLPQGTNWYNLYTGEFLEGGQNIQADAPYAYSPIFVKSGSIIPIGPEIQYSDEKPAEPLRLYVYTGQDGKFVLYEDDNLTYEYEKGKFATIEFTYKEKDKTLTIGARKGFFKGMLKERNFEIIWISIDKSRGMNFEVKPDKVVKYNGNKKIVVSS